MSLRALALTVGVLATSGVAVAADPPNAADLEAELVCPVCETTLDQSTAPVAERMKKFIRVRIAAGDTEQEIKAALVGEFGPAVLARPRKSGFGLLAWIVPLAALVAGVGTVGLMIRSWSRRGAASDDGDNSLDPELERLVDEELDRFDG